MKTKGLFLHPRKVKELDCGRKWSIIWWNEYVLGHYRSEWPLRQFLLSVFTIRNETLNVWTHLIGFFLFLSLTIYTAMKVPAVVDIPVLQNLPSVLQKADFQKLGTEFTTCLPSLRYMCDWHIMERSMKEEVANIIAPLMVRPITRWSFFAFLGGAMFCLLASSTCHLLSCHSKRLSYIMLRLDYAAIAALVSTSFYPPVYYSFMCYPLFCNLYKGFITC